MKHSARNAMKSVFTVEVVNVTPIITITNVARREVRTVSIILYIEYFGLYGRATAIEIESKKSVMPCHTRGAALYLYVETKRMYRMIRTMRYIAAK